MTCSLCPRRCGVDRERERGACGAGALACVARCAPHFWEEPCISGARGSGAVFFCGCNLNCVFCQNHEINHAEKGTPVDAAGLAGLMLGLQEQGVHNVNLVTPAPHAALIARAVPLAKSRGLCIPIVYNTNAYELADTLKTLEGLVDVYLPDFKYATNDLAARYSGAGDYPDVALAALEEMFRQCGGLAMDGEGMARRGVLVRHLVLPGNVDETRRALRTLLERFGPECALSLMGQYTPLAAGLPPPLHRRLTRGEYARAQDYCMDLGFQNVWVQELSAASARFVPEFDGC